MRRKSGRDSQPLKNCATFGSAREVTIGSFRFKGKARDSYLACVRDFPLTTITSDDHLAAAGEVMDRLLAKGKLDRGQQSYLDVLSDLAASYEDEHFPIEPASDADMLRHLLDAKGITQAQLHRETGLSKSSISEVRRVRACTHLFHGADYHGALYSSVVVVVVKGSSTARHAQ